MKRWKKKLPELVMATRSSQALNQIPLDDFKVREAISTIGLMEALKTCPVLVIADLDDMVESPEVSKDVLQAALDTTRKEGVVVVDSLSFNQDRERWLGEALLARGHRAAIRYMPRRVIMLTNYCGGVGKSTLSLVTARRFREVTGLPAATVEIGVGGSSMSRLGDFPTLFDVVTQEEDPGLWNDVHVYPSDDWETGTLATDSRTGAAIERILHRHTLIAFDTFPTNALWGHALESVSDVIVVTSPRPDALEQTEAMLRRLRDEMESLTNSPEVHLVLNQVQTVGQRLPLAGELSTWIGYDEGAALSLDSRLGDPILELIYPGWSKRKRNRGNSIFRKRSGRKS